MKSKKILIIVVSCIIALLVIGFVTYLVVSNNKSNEQVQKVNIEKESSNENTVNPKLLKVDCKNLTLFENSSYDISSFVITFNDKDWLIEYTFDDELIEITTDYTLKVKPYKLSSTIVFLKITPKFDYTLYDEFKTKTFPMQKNFTVDILPLNIDINYNITYSDINNVNINLQEQNIKLHKNNLTILSQDVYISEITEYNKQINLHNISLNNVITTNFMAQYNVCDDNNKQVVVDISIPLEQNKNYISYSWVKALKDEEYLYLTKNGEYNADFPNKAELVVNKNYDVLSSTFSLKVIEGDSNGLDIQNGQIIAKKVGEYTLELFCCNQSIKTFNISVLDVEIEQVNFGDSSYQVNVGDNLDLGLKTEGVKSPNYLADYVVEYNIISGEDSSIITNEGIFTCYNAGVYVVRISVRDFYQDITITAETLHDKIFVVDGDLVDKIDLPLSGLEEEYYVFGKSGLNASKMKKVLISTDNSNFLKCEPVFNLNTLLLKFNLEQISTGNRLTVNLTIIFEDDEILNGELVINFV